MPDRLVHDMRLIRDLMYLDPDRQGGFGLRHDLLQFRAEIDNVGALPHPDGKTHRLPAAIAEEFGGRILIAAPDIGHVGQGEEAVADAQVDVGEAFGSGELPADADQHPLRTGLDHARGNDGVLRRQRRLHRLLVEAERRQPLGREFEIDHLVAGAEDFHLAGIGQGLHRAFHVLDMVAHLAR